MNKLPQINPFNTSVVTILKFWDRSFGNFWIDPPIFGRKIGCFYWIDPWIFYSRIDLFFIRSINLILLHLFLNKSYIKLILFLKNFIFTKKLPILSYFCYKFFQIIAILSSRPFIYEFHKDKILKL